MHHTIEDVGIVLGQAIAQAVGDKKSICRYGDCILPMDEALILCAIDLSGRPYLGYEASIHQSAWEDLIQRWQKNFSMLFHIRHQ